MDVFILKFLLLHCFKSMMQGLLWRHFFEILTFLMTCFWDGKLQYLCQTLNFHQIEWPTYKTQMNIGNFHKGFTKTSEGLILSKTKIKFVPYKVKPYSYHHLYGIYLTNIHVPSFNKIAVSCLTGYRGAYQTVRQSCDIRLFRVSIMAPYVPVTYIYIIYVIFFQMFFMRKTILCRALSLMYI